MVHADFAVSLVVLTLSSRINITLIPAESALNMHNREAATKQARSDDCTHVLFLDSDMTFPADTIARLLAHDKDIVGCTYARRIHPHTALGRLMDVHDGKLQEAIELPSGCLMIRTDVFDKLEAPYFRCQPYPTLDPLPEAMAGFDVTGYEAPGTMSEDYYFCQAARRAGFKVWADMEMSKELTHIGMAHHRLEG